jgi:hypothetical protein
MQVTAQNIQELIDAAGRFNDAWGNIEDAAQAWVEFANDPPTDADGREERKSAREEIDGGLEEVESAVDDLRGLFFPSKKK